MALSKIEALGTKKANVFFSGIYKYDVFIHRSQAVVLSDALGVFLRSYLFEAHAAWESGRAAFALVPKVHGLDEIRHRLAREAKMADYCMNPAVFSCSVDEDFIGRCSYISRCVSPVLQVERTLLRYLVHIQIAWSRW